MNIETLFSFTPTVIATIPITLGIVACIKEIGLPSKWAPLASIVFGLGFVALTTTVWQVIIAQGVIVGLAASGLWSGPKATFNG